MKKQLSILAIALLSAATLFSSCKKDDDSVTPTASKQITIDASAYATWKYFSFESDTVVPVTDFATSTSWDIAFHRGDVRVNCGESGIGQGGSFNAGKVDFASVKEAPTTGYSLNTTIKILESYTMPPVYVTVPGDTLVTKWLTVVTSNSGPPSYTFHDYIYIIRTANGKYAKVWLKDYFNETGKGGYITMKYAFQADGSRKFE